MTVQDQDDREDRLNALRLAKENAAPAAADEIVADAEKFRAFLAGEGQA